MPRWATGAAGCETPAESPPLPLTGADGIPPTIEVFERKLHPRPLGQGYTCLAATPDAALPPPCVLLPHRWRCGRSPGRSRLSPLPPARLAEKTLCPKGTSHDESGGSAPLPLKVARSSRPEAPLKRTPRR
ncbi:hypothetical protein H6P81_021465 [Aristolochia fimbriata]|uniref:Uncharacterized protein n=1 Tax=Aristolochia fimbriata TaxID=158543 RepID=A0AAV7DPV6_ARIFI|nr:hypothetical protein H6P81_021465 [Aristolochia fimbriata]